MKLFGKLVFFSGHRIQPLCGHQSLGFLFNLFFEIGHGLLGIAQKRNQPLDDGNPSVRYRENNLIGQFGRRQNLFLPQFSRFRCHIAQHGSHRIG